MLGEDLQITERKWIGIGAYGFSGSHSAHQC